MPAKKPSKSSVKKPVRKPAKRGSKVPSLENHEQRISKLEDGQSQFGALVEQVRSENRAVADGQVMLNDTLRAEMAQGLKDLRGDIATLTATVRHLADEQFEMNEKLTQLTSRVGGVETRLGKVEVELSEVKGAIREQTERMESGEQRLQRLEAGGRG